MSAPSTRDRIPHSAGVTFNSPAAFWLGTAAVVAGVLAHVPDFAEASGMGFHMRGMSMSTLMLAGMALIVGGLALATYGIVPLGRAAAVVPHAPRVHVRALDGARLTRQHWGLLFILGVALIVDVMKPATLGFVAPGMKSEYGVTTKQIASLPLVALIGTTIGSLLWGVLADRVGRRAAILLASILFIGTSICGFMPSYGWNLFMCGLMGIAAGGMLPIVYALMTESMPARDRGWLVVLHGGLGSVGGYLAASGLAALLEPHFTWRILWFAGLPTGLILLVLNRWIPESPRFLLARGRTTEAHEVMRRYGVVVTQDPPDVAPPTAQDAPPSDSSPSRVLSLFRGPYVPNTISVGAYALGWGLMNWGFVTFTPTVLRDRGLSAASASRLLFLAALVSLPATVAVAYLYGRWSSKKSMILFAVLTAAALVAFAVVDPGAGGRNAGWFLPLMVALLVGGSGITAMLSPYTAEVYPTHLRGTGSGFAAACSKVGGVVAPPLAAVVLTAVPGFTALALVMAAPVALSAVILAVAGVETRDRALEEMSLPSNVDVARTA
ncbi:major facilitator superfamily MFS_1 [Gemmatirosa kalamazoonensis]|uniref:Major facilitator superfamily MFS_1 n=1 Tax=Gemmatirosa kalamazoonensis TaxID=861299 RepID=W0RPX3_9BACT|nr:MFS transporter [Gemmatirosa kalamazoonensis]AHG91563.1 major facilitator superfamily MFS_1 [Gemmatirosa kalamazoonensis]